jgi:hypothetical protein
MKELAKGYKKSLEVLNNRISKLEKLKAFRIRRTKDPEKDPDIIELNIRLRPLKMMLNDLRAVTREVEHYYDKGWWRSEKYTLNQRKSRSSLYFGPIYDEACDEYGDETEDEEDPDYGYGFIIDG